MAAEPFKAFISYSRGVSQPLAVDLQTGIERFAKPWYRLRGLRVFRDDSSMSANTALWSTIETGLRQSEWFILLATPEAAASTYVNAEIDWWLRNKGPRRLLIVQAAGELFWDRTRGRFDPSSTAVPPLMHAAYPEEPRWVDMRWYGSTLASEGATTAKADPRFTERVADLAAAIRGVERDTLLGENVRQHRRALRLARSAVVVLAGLLVLSIVASIFAVGQRNTARDQATIAQARQLAATARTLIPSDIGKARLLAVEAYRLSADDQTRSALLETVTASPQLVRQFDAGGAVWSTTGTADGRRVVAATRQGAVMEWDVATGVRTDLGQLDAQPVAVATSADGSLVAAITTDQLQLWRDGQSVPVPAGLPSVLGTVAVTDSADSIVVGAAYDPGSVGVRVLRSDGAAYRLDARPLPFSRGATQLVVADGIVTAWDEDGGRIERRRLSTGALVSTADGLSGAVAQYPGHLAPDGSFVAIPEGTNTGNMPIYRTDRGRQRTSPPNLIGYALGQDQATVALSPLAAYSAYADADTIEVAPTQAPTSDPFAVTVLRGITATGPSSLRFLSDRFLVSGSDNRLMLFDLDQATPLLTRVASTVAQVPRSDFAPLIVPNQSGSTFATPVRGGGFTLTEVSDGGVRTAPATSTFIAWRDDRSLFFADGRGHQVTLFDTISNTEVRSWPLDWPGAAGGGYDVWSGRYVAGNDELLLSGHLQLGGFDATSGATRLSPVSLSEATFSVDGRYAFGAEDGDLSRPTVLTLADQKRMVVSATGPLDDTLVDQGVFSGYVGGALLLTTGKERTRTFYSADGRTRLGDGPDVEQQSVLISVSPDGTEYAAHRSDLSIAITKLSGGAPVGDFPIPYEEGVASYAFSGDGGRLVVAVPSGTITSNSHNPHGLVMSIDLTTAGWIAAACRTAGRNLDPAEWTALTGLPAPADLRCAR